MAYNISSLCRLGVSCNSLRFSPVQWGLDLIAGAPCNSTKNGVLEPTINKVKLIQFATEAALTILRIDDMIKVEPDPAEEEQ